MMPPYCAHFNVLGYYKLSVETMCKAKVTDQADSIKAAQSIVRMVHKLVEFVKLDLLSKDQRWLSASALSLTYVISSS